MPKRDDFADFFSDDDDTPVIDTRADGRLYRVPLGRISPNLVNPRTEFGTEDELIDLGKSLARRQNQPCPVVSRAAYIKLWPDHGDRISDVDYILVSGERRYRAAAAVGLPVLDCVVNDDFASERKTFMEAVVSENVDRQNFDPIEEAYAVQALVAEFGSNRAVAQHFDRVDGWVTQRVLLTNLAREVQDLVRKKSIPLEAARSLGKLARDNDWTTRDQLAWWEEEQDRRAAIAAARSAARKAAKQQADTERTPPTAPPPAEPSRAVPEPASFTAVKPVPAPVPGHAEPAPVGNSPEPPHPPAVSPPAADPKVPEARPAEREQQTASGGPGGTPSRTLPYNDGTFVAHHLIRKMPAEALELAIRVLNQHAAEHGLNVLPQHTP